MFGLDNGQIFWIVVILIAAVYYTIQYVLTIIDRRNARKHGIDPLASKSAEGGDDDE